MHHERSALNNALSQLDRIKRSPAPAKVKVDGRSLAELLGFAADYGVLIQFYNQADQPDGDWSIFFRGDKSVALALCATLDLADIEIQFDRLLHLLRTARTFEHWLTHWSMLTGTISRLAGIIEQAENAPASFEHALMHLIESSRCETIAEPTKRLLHHFGGKTAACRLRHESIGNPWLEELHQLLDDFIAALVVALVQTRDNAVAELESSLQNQQHPPQSGLWDAFAQLFRHAQKTINSFPRHLLQFYQTSILRQDERTEHPDQVVLTFTPANGIKQAIVNKGTAFTAGNDEAGESIVYTLDSALTVDATSVTGLRTVTLVSQPLIPNAQPLPAQVLSGVVDLSSTTPTIATPFPLFGANTVGIDGTLVSTTASLGFAIASPCLLLNGGSRTIQLAFTVSSESVSELASTFNTICNDASIEWTSALTQLLQRAFLLRYSSSNGWIAIESYQVTVPADASSAVVISFQLDPDADGWTAFPQSSTGVPGPYVDVPTLAATLVQEPVAIGTTGLSVYPYTVLSKVELTGISITVDVSDLTDLQVSSPTGLIDTSQPFIVFGSPPVQYASLTVSATELFVKELSYFSLSIDWFGLPVTSTGFKGYYEAYVIDANGNTVPPGSLFNNDSFTASMNVVNPGPWIFDPTPAPQLLFETDSDSDVSPPPLQPVTVLYQTATVNTISDYYDPALSYVQLRLETPDYAFGNILYSPNIMAASAQLTAAASSCAVKCSHDAWAANAASQLEPIVTASTTASDSEFDKRIKTAIQQAVSSLDGAALSAIESAIAQTPPDQTNELNTSLSATLNKPNNRPLLKWLRRWGKTNTDSATVHADLQQWLTDHSSTLAAAAPDSTAQAQALLSAGNDVMTIQTKIADQSPSSARPVATAGVRSVQANLNKTAEQVSNECIQNCMAASGNIGFPNQPWLPMAKNIRVNYEAHTMLPPATAQTPDVAFIHISPFDEIDVVEWQSGDSVPLLTPITQAGSLYIDLSGAAQALSLLFQLAPPASGWPTDTPMPSWSQASGANDWSALTPQSDGTNGLRNSGVVRFTLSNRTEDEPLRLRVGFASGDAALFPLLSALATNAATATWQGPGLADRLGIPLPAGKITKSVTPLPDIGNIDQPMSSSGGRGKAIDTAFDMWLAERLRHKDYGIQSWDYANLVLAAFPSLWQVAIVPASNGTSAQTPGHVWIVPVPGQQTANIVDPTIPSSDGQMLSDIAAYLASKISPFIQLNVTNPPYLRLTVHAELIFTDDDSVQACITQLNQELIDFLSPWPSQTVGPRPENYYTRQEVANFVRKRPYVRGILSLHLVPNANGCTAGTHYYTSALSHVLKGTSSLSPEHLRRPHFALPITASAQHEEAI